MRKVMLLVILIAMGWLATASTPDGMADFYVATDGNDSWSGTLPAPNSSHTDGPFASLARAQIAVEGLVGTKPVTVMVRAGTYYLPLSPTNPGTLLLGSKDSGTSTLGVTWENYPGETPIVSGGIPVSGNPGLGLTWTNVSGNLWQVQLPTGIQPFEYLFYNGQRRLRARLEESVGIGYYMSGGSCISTQTNQPVDISFCNLGTFLKVAGTVPQNRSTCTVQHSSSDGKGHTKCLDRFIYKDSGPDPIANWTNLNGIYTGNTAAPCQPDSSNPYPVGDVELTLFDSWTVDVMRIQCIDTKGKVIYFTPNATKGGKPLVYNFFGPTVGHRYVIKNAKEAFQAAAAAGQTGLWFLDRSTTQWTLNYLANPGENPNQDTVVIPQLGGVIPGAPAKDYIGGSLLSAPNTNGLGILSYVTFSGITFAVDNFIPSSGGFNNDIDAELTVPQAIDCESCQNVTFDNVTVRHTSASGILIASSSGASGPAASGDVIQNSTFYDMGDSGIRIGHTPGGSDQAQSVVNNIVVQNNLIQGYSRVFPDGEGIAQGNGHDIQYLHNDIADGYHAGISVCLLGCGPVKVNGNNIVSQYNHIRNVMQGITNDGGALYYDVGSKVGSGTGNVISHNLVHDVTDASIIDTVLYAKGYGGEGIYLDHGSAGVQVKYNVVYQVSASTIYMYEGPTVSLAPKPDMFLSNILAYGRFAMFEQFRPWPQGCASGHLGAQVKISSNIFYFDRSDLSNPTFYVVQGCADSCGLAYNHFQNFQNNAYWRTDGGFSSDINAFHILKDPPPPSKAGICENQPATWDSLAFDTQSNGVQGWQNGMPLVNGKPLPMNEDPGGTVTFNPNFGNTGNPSDYLLSSPPPISGFDYTQTNDTINHAGRTSGANPGKVPPTFPTYAYTDF